MGNTPDTIVVSVADWEPRLRAEWAEIAASRLGVPLTADELGEWLKAVDQRNRAITGAAGGPAEVSDGEPLLRQAVMVPGTRVRLYAPTIAVEIRADCLRRRIEQVQDVDARLATLTEAYLLAHAHNAEALALVAGMGDPDRGDEWQTVVRQWAAAHLTCSLASVRRAIERARQVAYPPDLGAAPGEARPPTGRKCCAPAGRSGAAARKSGSTGRARRTPAGSCARRGSPTSARNGPAVSAGRSRPMTRG